MNHKYTAIAIGIVVIILMGQYVSYYSDRGSSITTETKDGTISYSVDVDYDAVLSEISISNPHDIPKRFMVLYDESYESWFENRNYKPTLYAMSKFLSECKSIQCESASAETISQMMEKSLSNNSFDTGLIIFTGSMPDLFFNGTSSSTVIQWMMAGGYLCWAGASFGKYISHENSIELNTNRATLYNDVFGMEAPFNDEESGQYPHEIINKDLTEALILRFNDVRGGISMSVPNTLFLGYTDGKYSSIGVTKCGSGMLASFGGNMVFEDVEFIVNLIATGICYDSTLISFEERKITNRSASGCFTDNGYTHMLILHDMDVSRIWVYDKGRCEFV